MKNKRYITGLLFILSAGFHLAALNLSTSSTYQQRNYDYNNGTVLEWTFTVSHSGEATSYFIGVSGGHSGNTSGRKLFSWSASDEIPYYVYDNETNKNILKDVSDNPSASEVISGYFPASGSTQYHTVSLTIVVPSGLFISSGTYQDTLGVQLYKGTPSSYTVIWQNQNINPNFVVPEVFEVSVVDRNTPFDSASTSRTFAFGVLSTGETRSADIVVRSTKGYELRIKSANQGAMKRVDIYDPSSTIPYYCYVNGTLYDLNTYENVKVAAGSNTSNDGDRHEIEIEIGDFWGVDAGDFEDIITIELTGSW